MSVHEFLCHLWYSWTLHCWWFELIGLNHMNQVCDQQCPNPRHVQSSLLGPPQQSTALHPPPLHRSYPSTQDPPRMPLPIGLPGCVLPSPPPVSPPQLPWPISHPVPNAPGVQLLVNQILLFTSPCAPKQGSSVKAGTVLLPFHLIPSPKQGWA